MPGDRPEHCRHCRHDDWPETFWTGLIDRPIVASCVDNRENKAPSLGVTMGREPTTEWLPLTERLALHHAGRRLDSTLPDISGLHRPVIAPVSALHQFDADTVWRGDVTQAAPVDAGFQLDRETDAFAAQLGAKCLEITLVEEAEMIGPPRVVTGKICKWPNGSGGSGVLARPLAADQDRHATQIDEDLRRPSFDTSLLWRGTDGSNPSSSSKESANFQSFEPGAGARKEGTKRCRGTLRIAASTRSSRAALPSSWLARSTWIPMTSTMCRRRIAKCASLIGFMACPTLMLVLVRSTRFAGRIDPRN